MKIIFEISDSHYQIRVQRNGETGRYHTALTKFIGTGTLGWCEDRRTSRKVFRGRESAGHAIQFAKRELKHLADIREEMKSLGELK